MFAILTPSAFLWGVKDNNKEYGKTNANFLMHNVWPVKRSGLTV